MSYGALAGPLFLGYFLSLTLYGVLTVQLYLYYAAFPKDAILIKTLVYSVYSIETARSILIAYDAYNTFVVGFADKEGVYWIRHIWFTCCVSNGILASIVQLLYAYRLKVLSNSYICGLSIVLLSVVQFVGAMMAGIGAKVAVTLEEHTGYEFVGYVVTKTSGALCDVLIAILMTYYLLEMRKRSRMAEDMITRIMRLVVEAGTLTSLFAIIDVVLYFTDNKHGSSWAFRLILGKLYSTSMMVVFNNRFSLRNNRYNHHGDATWRSTFLVSTNVDVGRDFETPVSFDQARKSDEKPQGQLEDGDGGIAEVNLYRLDP